MAPWRHGGQQRPPSWTTRPCPPTAAWHPESCFQGPSDRNPCPLGTARKPQLKWSNRHLLAGSSPWLQVNSFTLPSPTSLVTGEDAELGEPASGPGTHSPGSCRSRIAGRQWGSGPGYRFAPLRFLKAAPGLPGSPCPRCSGKRLGAPRKVGHLVTGPEQHPMLKGHPGRKGAWRTRKVSWEAGGAGGPGFTPDGEPGSQLHHGKGTSPSDQPQDAGHCWEAVVYSLKGPGGGWAPLSSEYREVAMLTQVTRPAGYQQPSLSPRHSEAAEAEGGGSSGKSREGGGGKGVPAGVGQRATHTNSLPLTALQAITSPFHR